MSIDKILKREGIEIKGEIDTLTQNTLAKNIASTLVSGLPNLNLNTNDLFIKISRLNMYYAKLPNRNICKVFLQKQLHIF